VPADGNPIKAVVDALTQAPQGIWIAASFEQMLENAVVLAREADKQLGLVEEDSKVGLTTQQVPATAQHLPALPCQHCVPFAVVHGLLDGAAPCSLCCWPCRHMRV
jgi:hypothetical protein